jgi:hypothetical protein
MKFKDGRKDIDLSLPVCIGDIQKRIPQHKTGIIQNASYNYAKGY